MSTVIDPVPPQPRERRCAPVAGVSSGVYGMALIGALVYYLQQAATFWEGVLGVLKAFVWPAILVYRVLDFLKG